MRACRTQPVEWTAEGAVNGIFLSILQRIAGVIRREYVSILQRGVKRPNQGGTADFIRP